MENVYLKPAPADGGGVVLVRDPASLKPLDAAGEWKPGNQYWTRRIRDKDVVVSSPPAATAVASAPAAPAPAPAEPIAASEPAAFTNCVTCPEPSVCRVRATCLHPHAPNQAPRFPSQIVNLKNAGVTRRAIEESRQHGVVQQHSRQRVGAVLLCRDQFRRNAVSGKPARADDRPEACGRHCNRWRRLWPDPE